MRTLRARLRAFGRAREGASAVEFALISPLLILFYFGMAETCELMMAQRRVSHSAAAMADLITQGGQLDKDELADILLAGRLIMAPFPTTNLSVRLTSVVRDPNNQNLADWSEVSGTAFTKIADGTPVAIKTPINEPGQSVLLAEVQFGHQSAVGYVLPGLKTLKHQAELRPRRTDRVVRCERASATAECIEI
ncbi:MAG TPA: TadE/TadG family type IV pilus assembly protein [Caulobacteraceae bacterium]|jgi:Flp pilus assembly protein TadG